MGAFLQFDRQKGHTFVSALCCGLLAASLALASPAFAAGGGGGGGAAGGRRWSWRRRRAPVAERALVAEQAPAVERAAARFTG